MALKQEEKSDYSQMDLPGIEIEKDTVRFPLEESGYMHIGYTALEHNEPVLVLVNGVKEECLTVPKQHNNTEVGTKELWTSPRILIDRVDAESLKEGENATFINWGNLLIKKINRENGKITSIEAELNLENKDYKETVKLTWLAVTVEAQLTPTRCVYFDHISKPALGEEEYFKQYIDHETRKEVQMLGDPELKKLKQGDIIQLQRHGFFKVYVPYEQFNMNTYKEQAIILFSIPGDHVSENPLGNNTVPARTTLEVTNKKENKSIVSSPPSASECSATLNNKIIELKDKFEKVVKEFLSGIAEYEKLTITDSSRPSGNTDELSAIISAQEDKIGKLMSLTNKEIKVLLNFLNTEEKSENIVDENLILQGDKVQNMKVALTKKVTEQGNIVKSLKAKKASKEAIDAAVKTLLDLKVEYKNMTGTDFPTATRTPSKLENKEKVSKQKPVKTDDGGVKKQTRLGLEARKELNLSEWYSQVVTKSNMIDYYDISGCYSYQETSCEIWDIIKEWFTGEIKKLRVRKCYYPLFVSKRALETEKTHIADFAPEVAWVTRAGETELAEPIAVRPSSETVMYPDFAKRIQSHRDLPFKRNQWSNVVRWEFKHPLPFLRSREFLWQEGHTAYASQEEAVKEVEIILDLYAKIYSDLLAIPVVKGRKTEKEKFAGADFTLTVEAFIPASGRAIQGATSHHLGQNFSKMFEIVYQDPDTQEKKYVYQNSWGITTRTIGVMIMVHGDNKGLVLPPKVAPDQVVIVPCGISVNLSEEALNNLQEACDRLEADLNSAGIRVKGDYDSYYSPGWKFNHWELKGVPVRVELGPKDVEKKQIVAVRRDTGEKIRIPRDGAVKALNNLLEDIQKSLYAKALKDLNEHKILLTDWFEFGPNLDQKNIILAPFCGSEECEAKIKADSARGDTEAADPGAPSMGAKSLCIPLEQPAPIQASDKCIHPDCQRKPQFYTLFGRSY